MAITEQQFIEAYKWLTPENQSKLYDRVNEEGREWINNYNASQSNQTQDTQTQGSQWNLGGWKYWDTSADRQEQIVVNLNDAYAQDPSKFADWNTFSNAFNYNYEWRSDKERETMRNWYQYQMEQQWKMDYNNTNNTDYFLSQLMNWQQLSGQWAATTAAYNRYKDYQSLSGMTPEQIASAVTNKSINPVGQSMIDLKNYSPALYSQVQSILQNQTQVDDINAVWTGIYDWLTKTETNGNYTKYNFTDEYAKNASVIKQYNESLYKKIEWLWWDTAAYVSIVASMLQNPLIQANKDEIENIEWEIKKIQDNIWTIWDSARTVLWSEAPEDLVSAYISQQTKELQTQLRTLNNSLLVAQWKLDNQLTEVDALIDAINQWLSTYWESSPSWWNNYQYVSWSKYQEAWYFDKSTWQFYRLWETPDSHDYQSSDPARLQEIADNLVNIANSSDVYVFRDRSAFNDYFKYNQRSAAQKAVLDEFWNANESILKWPAQQAWQAYQQRQAAAAKASSWWGKSSWWSWGSWGGWWWTSWDNDKWSRLKQAIINWDIAWSYDKTAMKKYWFTTALNEEEVAVKMAQICTVAEYTKLYNALWATARTKFNNEIKRRITEVIKKNWDAIKKRIKSAAWIRGSDSKKEAEAQKIAEELWINFGTMWKAGILAYYNQ